MVRVRDVRPLGFEECQKIIGYLQSTNMFKFQDIFGDVQLIEEESHFGAFGRVYRMNSSKPKYRKIGLAVKFSDAISAVYNACVSDEDKALYMEHKDVLSFKEKCVTELERELETNKVLSANRHNNILPVYGSFKLFSEEVHRVLGNDFDRDIYILVMPFCDATLDTYVGHILEEENQENKAIDIMAQLASAVSHIHSLTVEGRSLVHRDIKPSNIFVFEKVDIISETSDCSIMLGDFGCSNWTEKVQSTGSVINSINFNLSDPFRHPNMKELNKSSFQTDIFSMGMVFFFLLISKNDISDYINYSSEIDKIEAEKNAKYRLLCEARRCIGNSTFDQLKPHNCSKEAWNIISHALGHTTPYKSSFEFEAAVKNLKNPQNGAPERKASASINVQAKTIPAYNKVPPKTAERVEDKKGQEDYQPSSSAQKTIDWDKRYAEHKKSSKSQKQKTNIHVRVIIGVVIFLVGSLILECIKWGNSQSVKSNSSVSVESSNSTVNSTAIDESSSSEELNANSTIDLNILYPTVMEESEKQTYFYDLVGSEYAQQGYRESLSEIADEFAKGFALAEDQLLSDGKEITDNNIQNNESFESIKSKIADELSLIYPGYDFSWCTVEANSLQLAKIDMSDNYSGYLKNRIDGPYYPGFVYMGDFDVKVGIGSVKTSNGYRLIALYVTRDKELGYIIND